MTLATRNPPQSLQIGVKKRVEPCPTAKSQVGDVLSMHYRGRLFDSEDEFDSSISRNQPFEFTLGKFDLFLIFGFNLKY